MIPLQLSNQQSANSGASGSLTSGATSGAVPVSSVSIDGFAKTALIAVAALVGVIVIVKLVK